MKILRSLTIVPPELYVEREADRQVERILSDMGRPGYVLVARQMGKTNLLLNAKRRHNGNGELFVYLDASNPFPDIRSFFRNIVDLALELADTQVSEIGSRIVAARHSAALLPHKEHEFELRTLIGAGLRKLVICLDEIDALTRSAYSDQVFSFIRSVYFSGRSNYSEFSTLTYLLSGVAEPADIIKNKDISPFNIGEKIFLDDFSEPEFREFIDRAKLRLSEPAIARIHEWVHGYPRMCWDVCSELEERLATGAEIDPLAVDSVIKKLYFSDVDSPPVDNIKRIAEDNGEVRDSLMAIHYGRSETLTDQARTRLYLAGATRMSLAAKAVGFKNRVLEEALSESFLRALSEKNPRSRLSDCSALFRDAAFEAVLSRLPAIESLALQEDRALAQWLKGRSLFHLGRFSEAVDTLRPLAEDSVMNSTGDVSFFLGAAQARIERTPEAAMRLREAVDRKSEFQYDAAVELAMTLKAGRGNLAEAEEICVRLIASPSALLSSQAGIRAPSENLALLYLTLAQIQIAKGESATGRQTIEQAIPFCTTDLRLQANILLFDIDAAGHKPTILRHSIAILRTSSGFVLDAARSLDLVSIETVFALLQRADSVSRKTEIGEILQRLTAQSRAGLSTPDALSAVVGLCLDRGEHAIGVAVLEHTLGTVDDLPSSEVRQYYATLILLSPHRLAAHRDLYLRTFQSERSPRLADLAPLNNILIAEASPLSTNAAALALDVVHRDPSDGEEMTESQSRSLGHLREYLTSYRALSGSPNAGDFALAKNLLQRVSLEKNFDLPGFADDHYRRMQTTLGNLLRRRGVSVDLRRGEKYGRNDYVEVDYGGNRRIGKFKRFEVDLRSGTCQIVGRATPPKTRQ